MNMKDLSRFAMAGQAGTALKGAGKLASVMQGCMANPTRRDSQNEYLYRKGDQACLLTGSDKQTVTLMEDVTEDMGTARALMPDGKMRQIDVKFLSGVGNCMDDETEDQIKIIIGKARK